MLYLVQNDFEGFFDGLKLVGGENAVGDRRSAGPGNLNISNSLGMIFNHESSTHSHMFRDGKNDDQYYTSDNFKRFRQRYDRRIQNWRKQFQLHSKITRVYEPEPDSDIKDQTESILRVFNRTYPDHTFSLNVISR